MITHQEARKELKQILSSKIDILYDYITQQEKKDELLELYKQYYNKIPIGTSMYKVELEIARLERELKELKWANQFMMKR